MQWYLQVQSRFPGGWIEWTKQNMHLNLESDRSLYGKLYENGQKSSTILIGSYEYMGMAHCFNYFDIQNRITRCYIMWAVCEYPGLIIQINTIYYS